MLEPEFKKIPVFDFENYPGKKDKWSSWPGKRSLQLGQTNAFIWQLTLKEIQQKSGN